MLIQSTPHLQLAKVLAMIILLTLWSENMNLDEETKPHTVRTCTRPLVARNVTFQVQSICSKHHPALPKLYTRMVSC